MEISIESLKYLQKKIYNKENNKTKLYNKKPLYILNKTKIITFLIFQQFNFPDQLPVQSLDFRRQIHPPFPGNSLLALLAPRPHLSPFYGGRGVDSEGISLLQVADVPVRLELFLAGVASHDVGGEKKKSEQKN